MAQTLIWSHEALDDIDRIAEYISRDSRHHAQQVVERLFDLADELPAHPKLGRIVPELADPNVRERFLYSYRLIYELTEHSVHVLAVLHGKRLLESVERFSR
jgi:plasmid stabilization system protein ParE